MQRVLKKIEGESFFFSFWNQKKENRKGNDQESSKKKVIMCQMGIGINPTRRLMICSVIHEFTHSKFHILYQNVFFSITHKQIHEFSLFFVCLLKSTNYPQL